MLRSAMVCSLLVVGSLAQAGAIIDISEDNGGGEPLFGPWVEQGDLSVDFNPTTFKSLSTGDMSEIVDSQLTFTVMTDNILEIWIKEAGDFTLIGGPGTQASARASLSVFWEVIEIDGQAVPGIDGQASAVFADEELTDGGYAQGPWTGMLSIDVAGFLAGEGVTGTATKVRVTLDNTLATSSVVGSSAFIAKKDVDITIHVPEPASMSLLGLGSLAMAMGLRRRR
jgi:hypothetical protein